MSTSIKSVLSATVCGTLATMLSIAAPVMVTAAECAPGSSDEQCVVAPDAGSAQLDAPSKPGATASEAKPHDLPVDAIERIVHDYLVNHPEVLREAMMALQAKEREQQATRDQSVLAQQAGALFDDPDRVVAGNPTGAITIVEFFDYRCGYCRRAHPMVEDVLARNQDVRLIYKEFPILGEGSVLATRAALAARAQGGYHAFHAALMRADGPFDKAHLLAVAAEAGLDPTRLATDMDDPALDTIIGRNHQLAEALGISGTPAFVIGDRIVRGAPTAPQLHAMIAELRNQVPNATP